MGIKTNEYILRIFSSREKNLSNFLWAGERGRRYKKHPTSPLRGRFLLQKTAVVKISLKSSQLFIYKSMHREASCLLRVFKKCIVFG